MSQPFPALAATRPAPGEVTGWWRLAVLSVWHPALGAPLEPVAVVGLDQRPSTDAPVHLAWVPLAFEAADPWRALLAEGVTAELLDHWAGQSGAVAADLVDVPEGAVDLAHAAGLVLDELLTEVLPYLPDRGEG